MSTLPRPLSLHPPPVARFWVNNSSRMYLLEGAGELHRNYCLEVGARAELW
jgi:hypothetical protein